MEYKGIIKQRENWMTAVLFIALFFSGARIYDGQYIYIRWSFGHGCCFFEKSMLFRGRCRY